MRLSAVVTPRWTRKPDPGTDLDRTHPLCPDHCWPLLSPQGTAQCLAKAAKLAAPTTRSDIYSGSSSMAPGGKYGLVVRHVAGSDRTRLTALNAAEVDKVLGLDGRFTVLLAYRKAAAATGGPTFANDTAVSTAGVYFLIPHTDNLLYWAYGSNQLTLSAAGVTFADDLWAATAGARGMEIWQNGKLLTANSTVPTRTSTSCDLMFNAWTGAYNPSGDLAFVMTWRRQLPAAAIRSLSVNPWQVFQPPTWIAVLPTTTAAAGISGSQPAYMDAMGGVMRGGSSRGNVHSMDTFVAIAGVQYAKAGAVAGQQVDNETLTITENDAETPNTCAFKVRGFTPSDGQDVIITQGSINNLERLFAGTILRDTSGYTGTPANLKDQVSVIDYTWQLTRETITQRWTNVSATVIAQAIIAHAGRGFTSRRVEAGLPIVDEFTVTNQTHIDALQALAQRIGATVKPTYDKDVKFRITPDALHETDPTPLTAASALLTETTAVSVTRDLGQVITRQPVEGGGSNALTEVAPGETILPVTDASWYNPAGGMVTSGPQHVTYTAKQTGGSGAFAGPGAAPSVAPNLTPVAGSGVATGAYKYAYTDVTAIGESLPSPLGLISTGPISEPGSLPTLHDPTAGGGPDPGVHYWGVSFVAGSGETLATVSSNNETTYDVSPPAAPTIDAGTATVDASWAGQTVIFALVARNAQGQTTLGAASASTTVFHSGSNDWVHKFTTPALPAGASDFTVWASRNGGASWHPAFSTPIPGNFTTGGFGWNVSTFDSLAGPPGSNTANIRTVSLTTLPIGPAGTTARKIYRTAANAAYSYGNFKLAATLSDNTTTSWSDTVTDASLGAAAPGSNTTALNQVSVSGIAIGPSGTTARKLYRTAVGAAQLKLLATLSDNTTTTYTDSTADGSLGANAPTSDTSGLATVSGQILAGSTSLLTTSTAPFAAAGGWAFSADQRIRYTGLSGNSLTGIPASGAGSITATIAYGAPISAAPALTGIPASGTGAIVYTIRQGDPVNLRVVVEDVAAQAAIAALIGGGDDGVLEGALIQDGRISETEARARGQAVITLRKAIDVGVTLTTHDRNAHASRPLAVTLTQPACVGTFKLKTVTLSQFHPSRWPLRQASAGQRFTLEDLLRDARQAANG